MPSFGYSPLEELLMNFNPVEITIHHLHRCKLKQTQLQFSIYTNINNCIELKINVKEKKKNKTEKTKMSSLI